MPFINTRVLKDSSSNEKKAEIIKEVSETDAGTEVGPNPKDGLVPYTWCVIEEVEFENWGIGGKWLL